jgi:hypothetical protein
MQSQTVAPPLGRRYDVDGLHLALHRSGTRLMGRRGERMRFRRVR